MDAGQKRDPQKILTGADPSGDRSFFRDTVKTTVLTFIGKSVGVLIPFFLAAWFGVSSRMDIFFYAYGVIIYILGIICISTEIVIVPFIAELKERNEAGLGHFIGDVLLISILSVMAVVCLLAPSLEPILKKITSFSHEDIRLLFWVFIEISPLVVFMIVNSVLSGVFNAYKSFTMPALSPAFRAGITLGFIFLFKSSLGIHAIATGYVAGEIVRFAILLAVLSNRNYGRIRFRVSIGDKTKEYFRTISYQALGLGVLGLNSLIDKTMGSWLGPGSVSILEYAERLYTIPVVFLTSGVMVTTISHWSTRYYSDPGNKDRFHASIKRLVKAYLPFAFAVAFLLIVASKPLTDIFYGHGRLSAGDLDLIRMVWVFLLLGLTPYCLTQVLAVQYLVLKKTYIFLAISIFMNIGNIFLNLFFMRIIGLPGIAFATSLVYTLAGVLMTVVSMRTYAMSVKT